MRVLVAGSEPVTRSVVEMTLRGAGHEPLLRVNASSAAAALAVAAADGPRFDLVIVDATLEGGAQGLYRFGLSPDAPCLIALAGDPDEAAEALTLGAIEALQKPLDRKGLLACVSRLGPSPGEEGSATQTTVRASPSGGGRPDLDGQLLAGKYEVQALLGQGGMGSVYRAHHRLVDELVAVKVIQQNLAQRPASRARFLREARTNMRLCHPNVIAVRDCGTLPDGTLYMAMDFSPGVSLRAFLRQHGALPEARVLRIAWQCADALRAAHQHGVVHRDLKPDNVLLETGDVVRVCDFGLAKLFDPGVEDAQITTAGVVVGTPHYMSPEQCEGGEVDGRTDLYSLGCLLFECLTGQRLFGGASSTRVLDRQRHEPPRTPSSLGVRVSARFESLILRLLAKRPDDRPATAQAVLETLAQLERNRTGGGLRVLLADDSAAGRRLVAGVLERWGHGVTATADGSEAAALATAPGANYDLILLDGEMPGLDGVEAAAMIRSHEAGGRRVPVGVLTSISTPEHRGRCVAAGVDLIIAKPLRPNDLAAALARISGSKEPPVAERLVLFDLKELLERVEGDQDLLRTTLTLFLEDSARLGSALSDAVDADDRRTVARAAHELKGAAANCAASALSQAANCLEDIALGAAPLGPALARVRRALDRTRPVLLEAIRDEVTTAERQAG